MSYRLSIPREGRKRNGWRWVWRLLALATIVLIVLFVVTWQKYRNGLEAVGGSDVRSITVEQGDSMPVIAAKLKAAGLIRSTTSFEYYARFHKASQYLQAGSYELSPSETVPDIISQLTHGKVATTLVTILPGQRLDQIRQSLIDQGFSSVDVDAALEPTQYEGSALFVGKPKGAKLEGYLYPDSFQRTGTTTAKEIVERSLAEMQKHLTPDVIEGFKKQNLTVYQAIIIASVVTKEVTNQTDRTQAAQVFLKRIQVGMPLGSDVTAHYGSILAGKGKDVTYDSPYNTRIHSGYPPTPISNVDKSALMAVAKPAATDWLFFVTGDDGTTYFSKTVAEHEALAAKYCHKLCQE